MQKRTIAEFGNPVLRQVARAIPVKDIPKTETQNLIKEMRELLTDKKLGVGLAAPQVGKSSALAIVAIRPSKHRPKVKPFDLVIINPSITATIGRRAQLYEGCISGGPGKAGLFAKVPRYKKIEIAFHDETGRLQKQSFEGLPAHVIQHEVDHLNGILFVDRVKDTKSYMSHKEYVAYAKKRAAERASKKSAKKTK